MCSSAPHCGSFLDSCLQMFPPSTVSQLLAKGREEYLQREAGVSCKIPLLPQQGSTFPWVFVILGCFIPTSPLAFSLRGLKGFHRREAAFDTALNAAEGPKALSLPAS